MSFAIISVLLFENLPESLLIPAIPANPQDFKNFIFSSKG